jgi:hypothetical protein
MGELREPSFEVVIGFKGVGKTYTTNAIIDQYIKNDPSGRKGRPVLVFDINNEYCDSNGYYGFKAIDFDVTEKNENKRCEQIRKIVAPGKYRILPYRKDRQPMGLGEMITTATTIVRHYRNGLLVLEDINKYSMSSYKQDFVGMFIGLRHLGVDLVAHFQSLRAIPPRVWQNMNFLRWHKQSDAIYKYKNRIDNFELFAIAEQIIEYKYGSDEHYFLWVDVLKNKLDNVSKEDFKQGCISYLNIYGGALSKESQSFDETGQKKYKNSSEAINGFAEKKARQYLRE